MPIPRTPEELESDRETIISSCAKMMFAMAWIDLEEEEGRTYPGCNVYDVMPCEVPASANATARELVRLIEERHQISNLAMYFATQEIFAKKWGDLERFGECLAYEACGAGVSWTDDYSPHGLKIPYKHYDLYRGDDGEVHGDSW